MNNLKEKETPGKKSMSVIKYTRCKNMWMALAEEVVVAKLAERSVLPPEMHVLNPIWQILQFICLSVNCKEETKTKKKEAGNGPVLQ